MSPRAIGSLLRKAFDEWLEDKAPRLGAALAYYAIFSLAPLLIIVIGIAGLVFGEQAARGEIVAQLKQTVGETAASAIEEMLKNTQRAGDSWWATGVGLAILFFGATGLFVQLQDALNTIWKVAPKPGRPLLSMLRERLLSFIMVLGTAVLLLILLIVSATLSALNRFVAPEVLPSGIDWWHVMNGLASFGLTTLLFALIYKVLPDVRLAWRDVWIGAVVTAMLFAAGKYLIGLYLEKSGTTSAFGAAGSLVAVLLWIYYSAQILLFGAEFTRVCAQQCGSDVRPAENAVAVGPEKLARQGISRGT